MPFKSKAQRRKFAELLVKGEISPETYEEWNRETGGAKLPERVSPRKGKKKKKKTTPTRRLTSARQTQKKAAARRPRARSKASTGRKQ